MRYIRNHYWNNLVQYDCIFNCGYKVIPMMKYIPNLYWNNLYVLIRLYSIVVTAKGTWEEKIATASMQRILHVKQTDPLLLTSSSGEKEDRPGENFYLFSSLVYDLEYQLLDHLSISVTQFEYTYIVFLLFFFVCLVGWGFFFWGGGCFLFCFFCSFVFFLLSSYMCKAFYMRVHLNFSLSIRLYRKSTERASLSVHVTQTNIPILSKN